MGAYGPLVRVFDGPWWARSNTRVCVPTHPRHVRGWRAHVPYGPLRHPAGDAGDLNPKLEIWLYVDFLHPPYGLNENPKLAMRVYLVPMRLNFLRGPMGPRRRAKVKT